MTIKLIIRLILLAVPGPVILMLASGDARWSMGWVFAAFSFVYMIASRLLLMRRNPDLIAERSGAMKQTNVEPWDKALVPLIGVLLPTATLIVGGLDHRFHGTHGIALGAQAAAYVPMLIGLIVAQWAAMENAFFSAVVRIQEDRGQTVVTTGPYRVIRHPGYAGSLLFNLALPLALGSLWAYIPVVVMAVLMVVRTALEDRTLIRKLPGYAEYAMKTRRRLLPGIW